MNKLNFCVIRKISIFTNVTKKSSSLIITGLADVDGFLLFIQVCLWPRFPPLVLQANAKLVQKGQRWTLNQRLGEAWMLPPRGGGDILLLDFFCIRVRHFCLHVVCEKPDCRIGMEHYLLVYF